MHKFLTLLRSYRDEQDGAFAVMAAVTMLFLVLTVGLSLDYSRLTQLSTRLKATNDFAALAAAKDPNLTLEERQEIFGDVMSESLKYSDGLTGFEFELSVVEDEYKTTLAVTSQADAALFFYHSTNEKVIVTANSEVQVGKESVEVALVLDISSSMKGQRIIELQAAAKGFVNTLLGDEQLEGRVSISLVPYGGTVRLPASLETMLIQPSTTSHWVNGDWNGCLSLGKDGMYSGLNPTDSFTFLPNFYSWNKNNPWCPKAGNELVGLSNDKDLLNARIDSFSLSDGTGTDVGVAWGHATLNPAWRNGIENVDTLLPRDNTPATKKIMVLMTDGGVTNQFFPTTSQMTGNLPYYTKAKSGFGGYGDFARACNNAKADDIEVFTVGFLMNNNNQIRKLRDCATFDNNHSTAGVGTLDETFQKLAESISSLRLSR